jgi:hypothetical protein
LLLRFGIDQRLSKMAEGLSEQKASDGGLDTLDRSLGNMRSMFEAAENDIRPGSASSRRSDQLKWQTFVARLGRKISRERELLLHKKRERASIT